MVDKKRSLEILGEIVDLGPKERAEHLDKTCGDDHELRREIEQLLVRENALAPQDTCPVEIAKDVEHPQEVGPYRILDVLGKGGMGMVYLAEQREPVRRRVALKLIKLGMDSQEVVARFEAERQALALMDHPNIARVYDAGATEGGRPYFVMEHVRGVPLDEYCDRHKLTIRNRLGLFRQVCEGVQHAHHRGIIHRDLKPSNVLVSTPDEKPVAKIIDFGVARATNQRLTEKTIYTELGRLVGTPAYMSSEQAELTSEDVDHRTDVYSLGVILYELLVGELPLDPATFSKAAFDEIMRRIREEDPPTPSTRWSRLNVERMTDLAAKRRIKPIALGGMLRRDLDWICMKALEKERERRYASAKHFADDVERHLADEPVSAGPPSVLYKLRKYVRKNRGPVTAAACLILVLLTGLALSLVLVRQSLEREEALKEIARVRLFADAYRVEQLIAEADDLWPPRSDMVPEFEEWLESATAFADGLAGHQAELAALRASLPYSEEERRRDRESHPLVPDLVALREQAAAVESEIERLRGLGYSPADDFTIVSYGTEPNRKHPAYYFRGTFELDRTRAQGLEARIAVDDGAVVYLNASEFWRVNMPDGEVGYTTSALSTVSRAPRVEESAIPVELLRDGRNLVAVEVHQSGPGSSDIYFDLELIGSSGESRPSWRYHDRGTYLESHWKSPAYDDADWRRGKAPFGYGFDNEDGPRKLAEEIGKLNDLEGRIARLEALVSTRRSFTFDAAEKSFVHETLSDLVERLRRFCDPEPQDGNIADVRRRLEFARTVRQRTVLDCERDWKAAIEGIAGSPAYGGLIIEPQEGLIPLGKDPDSGLWEFAHLQSGEPARRVHGKLQLTEQTGLVFVLIPGGSFHMGAEPPSEAKTVGSPNIALGAWAAEGPIHEVRLGAFFISKYEMTQGQWKELTGDNPTFIPPGRVVGGRLHTLLHPVDNVSWHQCGDVLRRSGLRFPTEAQWEYAARARTSTPWSFGEHKESLLGAANLRDLAAERSNPTWGKGEKWDDGFAYAAPVGTFKANDFGLHDTSGNVMEWCLEPLFFYWNVTAEEPDGERRGKAARPDRRIVRGAAWDSPVSYARTAYRHAVQAADTPDAVGIRPARALEPTTP